MQYALRCALAAGVTACLIGALCNRTRAGDDEQIFPLNKREQLRIEYRDPIQLPAYRGPQTEIPPTVIDPRPRPEQLMPLDEAIRIALGNAQVVRVLAGNLAVSSGSTIYDPAVANTFIDQQRAAFDPQVTVGNTWSQTELPVAGFGPGEIFGGDKIENHNLSAIVSQRNLAGGTAAIRVQNDRSIFDPNIFPLDPQNRSATELSYTQPLLRGRGIAANRVPIVLAQIDTERSFFQLRDNLQELVRGVIEAYWAVVFARTDVWARDFQVRQAQAAYERAQARLEVGFADITEVAQSRSALAQFRANLISAEANLLQREAALRNIMGLSASAPLRMVPSTPPTNERIVFDWDEILRIAETRRPDLIELKLILEADTQRRLLAQNQAQPNLDVTTAYRWNGLEGRTPSGQRVSTSSGDYTDWAVSVTFAVPLYLRQERAVVRSLDLLIARDRANLEQGLQSVQHILALRLRDIDQAYLQYQAFREAREAARINLEQQFAAYATGGVGGSNAVIFLNVLQAITDWGNAVSQEAQALTTYNTALANLERDTGTILETHGVWLVEDRYCSLGPMWLGRKHGRLYPRDIRPQENAPRYPEGNQPSENSFDLDDYPKRESRDATPQYELPPPPPPEIRNPEPVEPKSTSALSRLRMIFR